ncbi:MAG: HlyD family efflux transporter periplasmic adaptor subunit [bacterium]|nr:HlyD family efflux transporter periplasmic adaptor subunit [bacterium]
MPEDPPATKTSGTAGSVAYLDQALWGRLASARTAEELCSSWLGLQARIIDGVSGGLVLLRVAENGPLAPVSSWPQGSSAPDRLSEVARRASTERRGIVTRAEPDGDAEAGEETRYLLGYPVTLGDRVHGVAAIEISQRSQDRLHAAMRQLQWGVAWLLNWVLRETGPTDAHDPVRLQSALELTALALEQDGFNAAATGFATEIATRLECDRVSVGFRQGRKTKVRALSHSAQFVKQMNLIRSIGMAMGESIEQNAVLVLPEPPERSGQVLQMHEQLARTHGDGAICTVPFGERDGTPIGAMTFERSANRPFDADTVDLCDVIAAIVGPVLEGKRQNDHLLIVKVWHSFREQFKKLIGPRHVVRKLVAIGIVALVLFFSLATGRYRVTAETVLEGEVRRVVVAPFRGYIREAQARAGDIVREGRPLCSLDERDLRLEYSRWSSEREQYAVEHRQAMAERDAAAMNVLGKKMRQAEAQIALLEEQLNRARILAPFDGVVVSGDLSQSLGAPVEAGDVLFEVTPLDAYRLMLKVDEREIGEVHVGQTGELVLSAMPENKLPFTVTRITPVSTSEEGRNFFTVEAALDEPSERLRPGMEGFAKVDVDRRKLIWIWTHEMTDWFRLKAWTWF